MIRFQSTFTAGPLGKEPTAVTHDCDERIDWSDCHLKQLLASTSIEHIRVKTPVQQWDEPLRYRPISDAELPNLIDGTQPNCWIAVHEIESHPALNALFQEVAKTLESSLPPFYGKAKQCTGTVFISRGAATTPLHMDYGSNLLLQVRGNKRFLAFSPNDSELVPSHSLEEFFDGNPTPPAIKYDPAFEARALVIDLEPGTGVYMPATSPHCTKTTTRDLSVTISLAFISPLADQLRRSYQFDRKLPAMRWFPTHVKCAVVASYEGLRHLRGRPTLRHESYKPFPF